MQDIRWRQRFQNFKRAYTLLSSALGEDVDRLSELEREGIIQRFEYTYELAWKTLKDYLEYNGIVSNEITPRAVFKEAFASKIIRDGQVFIDMMLSRNLLSHCYDFQQFTNTLILVKSKYLPALTELYEFFVSKSI